MTKRVAIICGGRSSEHEISCISAGGVIAAIDRSLYEPVVIGITQSGKWVIIPEGYGLSIKNGVLPVVPESGKPVSVSPEGFAVEGKSLGIEIVFPVLHGPYGEDGTIQGLLEIADIPFVGSGVLASAVAMDKSFAKPIFAAHGIKVAEGLVIRESDWKSNQASLSADVATLGYPVFVKPARGGSSRGTTKVKSAEQLVAAVEEAHRFDPKAMVENAVVGREIECAVLEINGKPKASIVGQIEIDSKFEFYDFEAKYRSDETQFFCPSGLDDSDEAALSQLASSAFHVVGCTIWGRVDVIRYQVGAWHLLEVNTVPGMTSHSLVPLSAKAAGLSLADLLSRIYTDSVGVRHAQS